MNKVSLLRGLSIVRTCAYVWVCSMELEYKKLGYMTKSVHYKYVTAFTYFIVIETCTFLRLIYPGVASIVNATAEVRGEVMGGDGVKFNPYRTPMVNTFLLLYISVSANWSLRMILGRNIRRATVWLRGSFVISTGFLVNQYLEFSALLTTKFQDSVYSCSIMSVLGLHRSHVFIA